jgi:hypothetical protein
MPAVYIIHTYGYTVLYASGPSKYSYCKISTVIEREQISKNSLEEGFVIT